MARGYAAGGEEPGLRAFEVVIEQPSSSWSRRAGAAARFGRRGRLGRAGGSLALAFACACATVWVVSDDGGGVTEARVEGAIDEQLGEKGLRYAHARGWSRAQALFLRDTSVRHGVADAHGGGAEGEWARFQARHSAARSQLSEGAGAGAGSSAWSWVQGGGAGADRTLARGVAGQRGLGPDAGLEVSREAGSARVRAAGSTGPGKAARAELSGDGRSRGRGDGAPAEGGGGAKVETLWDFPEIRRMQVP